MQSFKHYLEEQMRWKSGGFPSYIDPKDGQLYVCLFVSNDPAYGGARPQMPKGTRDDLETPKVTGAREAAEETGIPYEALVKNAKLIMNKRFVGQTSTYIQYVFEFPLDRMIRAKKNDEGHGIWLKYETALKTMRKDQRQFLANMRKAK